MPLLNNQDADVAELADALRSGRSSLYGSVGSTPTIGTQKLSLCLGFFDSLHLVLRFG